MYYSRMRKSPSFKWFEHIRCQHTVFGQGDQITDRILFEQVESLAQNTISSVISGTLVALNFVCIYYWREPNIGILVWFGIMVCWQLYRILLNRFYDKQKIEDKNPNNGVLIYSVSYVVACTLWGATPWIFFPKDDILLVSIIIVLLLGLCSGAMGIVSAHKYTIYAMFVPMLTGLATALIYQGGYIYYFLAACVFIYLILSINLGLKLNLLLTDSLRSQYENEALAKQLADQVRIVEKASLEKTRFFASASHDLRQPLHSLGLFGSTILKKLEGTPDEQLGQNLMHCVDALETSFSTMLDVSKLDAGVVQANNASHALGDIFRTLQTQYGRLAEEKNLSLRFKPGNKWVTTDRALLERLLGNLIHNALKFTTNGGVSVIARTRGDIVSVEIWDSGKGMHKQDLPRIFDEFYQIGNPERDRSLGLGMGLSIVRRLSNLMSLMLDVKSVDGRGTVFKILIPGVETPTSHERLETNFYAGDKSAHLRGLRIMVVDDEATVRESTARALRDYGLVIEIVDGIDQARDRIKQLINNGTKLDAVISDFRLRNHENGITLIQEIRTMLNYKLPAVLVTGDTAPDRVHEAKMSGIPTLYKPVTVQKIIQELTLQLLRAK